MSFFKQYCFVFISFVLIPSNISADIAIDYFFGEASLRSEGKSCEGEQLKHECRWQCGPNNFKCISRVCLCLDRDFPKNPKSSKDIRIMLRDFDGLIEVLRAYVFDVEQAEEEKEPDQEEYRPALRHHIAHFCPDLEIARQCIRTCMKVGKPAFCGKDHNCYCGHKYSAHDKDKLVDVDDIYAQFRDLYEKYFGTQSGAQNDHNKS